MRAAISIVFTLAFISLGMGLIATFIQGGWPDWTNLLLLSVAVVLGGAALLGALMDKRRNAS